MSDSLSLITGGAGFIGSNLAHRLLSAGQRVRTLDSLARPGVEQNLQWLQARHGDQLQVVQADVRDADAVLQAVQGAAQVFHFAAQVAVTTSLESPREDFGTNALGTLNVLEAARAQRVPPFVLMTSTNKVYGDLGDLDLRQRGTRWEPSDPGVRDAGIGESRPLDFHSPYGCSKGCADQYVLDWARSYGLSTVVLRMSCIYGPRQFGTEDQGWVAHFILRALRGESITLYGDGRQVRDVLFIDDLVDAFLLARQHAGALRGRAFNMGGGPANAISLLDLLERIGSLTGRRPATRQAGWRTGDQRWYVSDPGAFAQATGWRPQVRADDGIERLLGWMQTHRLSTPLPDLAAVPAP